MTGHTLLEWGFPKGSGFREALAEAQRLEQGGVMLQDIKMAIMSQAPVAPPELILRTNSIPFARFIEPENDDEFLNTTSVLTHMDALLRTPTIERAAVMPDACPSGSALGTIPVGGVVATKGAIHPGFHSADICCSMFISVFKRNEHVGKVLDAAMKVTHFGPGGRDVVAWHHAELNRLIAKFDANPFLKGLEQFARNHFMTQGDGNHFLYVGGLESTGELAVVTHHGSRGLGAQLYKRGKAAAERHTKIVAPRVPLHNAWIPADTQMGDDYWEALQIIREWTKLNHAAIHRELGLEIGNAIQDQFWNEHNFVFRRSDGLFYHAKGATPSFDGFAADDENLTLIPLNMAQPILIARHTNNEQALGFAPHGAGRNLSRTNHIKRLMTEFGDDRGLGPNAVAAIMERETQGLDVRFYTGKPDVSELPSAYKNADQVHAQIRKHNLAEIVDTIQPRGSIMAGDTTWKRR
ncbi:RtcB family protein [Rhizobium ruizarguesonis]|uniref:RtcB family protein n=1 Tax=Rhizobium ruizarguesonis TaxID=2081791 RepID=UPI00163AF2E8|nr:RtcB family protein [Rhizobium ruizarguesonis]MBC2806608.1 RtcB family protein [Rhizobium ruizarguesonis]